MKVKLAYGKSGLDVDLPNGIRIDVVEPKFLPGTDDQAGAVGDALRRPIGSAPLRELVQPSDRVGIIFSDLTRPTPYPLILPQLLAELEGVPDRNIILFNATGTHRANTEVELRRMLGDEPVERFRIVQNNAEERDSHERVGKTVSGNEIRIHRELMGCSARILTGFIEPHFFAGFSGGGKAIMPGLAALETIFRNHSPANIDHPQATWSKTRGNPIWEEVREAAEMVGPTFLVNVTLNRDKEITGVFAGHFEQAHARGCAASKETAMVGVPEAYDIVISSNSGYPLDLNLYQSVKGMSAASQIVKPGGCIIMASDCWDGIPEHGEYGKLLQEAADPQSLLEAIRRTDAMRQDMWQVQIQAQICLKADVYFYSRNLTDEQIRGAHLRPCRDIGQTVVELMGRYGEDASICVLPEGPQTIPYILSR